jgi:hypothetical protein
VPEESADRQGVPLEQMEHPSLIVSR